MEQKISQIKKKLKALLLLGIWTVAVLSAVGFIVPALAENGVSVSCYNIQKSEHPLGNVAVYDTSQAAKACNSVYYDCKGNCVGCFSDSDYLDTICIDIRGTIFLK
jgi:hypothetical protein